MPTYQKSIVLILSRPVEERGQGGWGHRWARIIVNEACVGVAYDSGVVFNRDKLVGFINGIKGIHETSKSEEKKSEMEKQEAAQLNAQKIEVIKKIRAHFAAPAAKIERHFA